MSEITNRSWLKGAAVFSGLGVAIFLVGAVIGYCRGAFGDGGIAAQGFGWAIKTGLLSVAMSAMSAILGVLGGLLSSRLQLHAFIGWAFWMGLAFAIMNGGGTLLGMNDNEFWPETIKRTLQGALIGAIAVQIIQRNQLRRIKKTQLNSETSTDQRKT